MTDDDRLDRWLEEWEDRRDRGEPVGPDEYLAVVGGGGVLAAEFRRRAAALLAVAGRLLPPPAADGDAPQTGLGAGAAAGDDTPGGGAAGTDPAGLPAGTMLGQFRVVGRLGRGGMGVVYEAEDTLLGRRVAVKTLPAGGGADDPEVARLLREARAAARLNHPHVLAVYHVGEWAGGWFLVLELAPGGSLQDRLTGGRGVPWRVATRLAADACRGVQAAHAAGLVHRDLKPGNLLVGADGRVRVADFGLVRGAGLSSSGSGAGTPAYMSPEQCRGEAGDARSDVYALGATYYALLTGRPPFPAENAVGAIYAHCHAPVPDPRAAAADVPAAAARVIGRAMAKDPAARYPTAGDLLEALAVVEDRADAEPFDFAEESLPTPERPRPRRQGRWVAVGAAALIGLALTAVGLTVRPRGGDKPAEDAGGRPQSTTGVITPVLSKGSGTEGSNPPVLPGTPAGGHTAQPAAVAAVPAGGPFFLVSVHSGLSVDAAGVSGAPVLIMYPPSTNVGQWWNAAPAGGGWFYFEHAKSGLVLSASGDPDGKRAILLPKTLGNDRQLFRALAAGPTAEVRLNGKGTNDVLGIQSGRKTIAAQLLLWQDTGAPDQLFRLVRAAEAGRPAVDPPRPPVAKVGPAGECPIADGVGMRFCWVPAGSAELGSPPSETDRSFTEVKRAFTTEGFWLGKYEVTQREWRAVMGTNPRPC